MGPAVVRFYAEQKNLLNLIYLQSSGLQQASVIPCHSYWSLSYIVEGDAVGWVLGYDSPGNCR